MLLKKYLLIAEKPSLMRDIQAVYRAHKNKVPVNIADFSALAGHICGYDEPARYSSWNLPWEDIPLPMIPQKWQIHVADDKKAMYASLKKLIKENAYDGYICATDADREGNLIFYLLNEYAHFKGDILRLWIHDLTEPAILDALQNMVNMNTDALQVHLTQASVLRSKLDWLIGMNATVAATRQSGMLMRIGRVKAPTLKLVYDNSMAIDNFKPKTYFGVDDVYSLGFSASLKEAENGMENKTFETREQAVVLVKQLSNKATVTSVETEDKKQKAPQFFKLADLQVEANRIFGYSAAKTLEIAQELYENDKVLSYPRCDCRYISEDMMSKIDRYIAVVCSHPDLKKYQRIITGQAIERVKRDRHYVNTAEVNKNSHTALMPTVKVPQWDSLNKDKTNILLLVYKRFLAPFLPAISYKKTTVRINNNGHPFATSGRIITDLGFSVLYNRKMEDKELPSLTKGQVLSVTEHQISEKTTTPPDRLTEGKLIAEMENISKYITDKTLKSVMKTAKGIGTPATRAAIISELIKSGYIDVKKSGKQEFLCISDAGKQYIENISAFDFTSPELTATWEQKLKSVEAGEYSASDLEGEITQYTSNVTAQVLNSTMAKTARKDREVIGKCPICGKDVVEGKKAFGCIGYKSDPPCRFAIWKDNKLLSSQKKNMTKTMAKALLTKGKTSIKGLTSAKTGKKYDAILVMDIKDGTANYHFEFATKKKKGS